MIKKIKELNGADIGKVVVFLYRVQFGKNAGKVIKQSGRLRGVDFTERQTVRLVLEGGSTDFGGQVFRKELVFKRDAEVEIKDDSKGSHE